MKHESVETLNGSTYNVNFKNDEGGHFPKWMLNTNFITITTIR